LLSGEVQVNINNEMGCACDTHGIRSLVGKREGMRVLESCRGRREDNSKTEFKETGWYTVEWINLADDRKKLRSLVNASIEPQVIVNAGNFLASLATISILLWILSV
jgi:hypothetical protein